MSIKGFVINGQTQRYDYDALDNKPDIPSGGGSGLTDDIKTALLKIAEKVAYIDANGQTYYDNLYDALYAEPTVELVSISAVYTQRGTVYDSASLDSLKPDLVVTAHYDNGAAQAVTGYTLSGTLTVGTSTITVIYQGKTATFNVTVTATPTVYTITNTLTAVTNSNDAVSVYGGSSYSATLSATESDYVITTVSITMGGVDVTGTAYSNGTISIANVTGNIVITAVATQRSATLSSISAVFVQGSATIYPSTPLNNLKQYLTVTANWSDSTSSTVAAADYTLSGTLATGTSTITVSYGGKTTTFTCTVSAPLTTTISWTGTGSDKTSTLIDARDHDAYFTLPFVSNDSHLAEGSTASSTAGKLRDTLLYDADTQEYIGCYRVDQATVESTQRSTSNSPDMHFETQYLVIPRGYYGKIEITRANATEAFTTNGNIGSYLNANGTEVTLV